jgi:hypothetical protein
VVVLLLLLLLLLLLAIFRSHHLPLRRHACFNHNSRLKLLTHRWLQ